MRGLKFAWNMATIAPQTAAIASEFISKFAKNDCATIATSRTGLLSSYTYDKSRLSHNVEEIVMSMEIAQNRMTMDTV